MTITRNILLGFLIIILLTTSVNAQINNPIKNQNSSEILDSMIMKYSHAKDLKRVSFNENDCTFMIEFENRTIKGMISNISSKGLRWDLKKNDLILILSSHPKTKAFFEIRSTADTENFETFYLHFNANKTKNEPKFKNIILDTLTQLIKQCETQK